MNLYKKTTGENPRSQKSKGGKQETRFPDSIACQCGVDQHRGRRMQTNKSRK